MFWSPLSGRRISDVRRSRSSAPVVGKADLPIERAADFLEVGGLFVLHLDQRAAGEFDRQVQALGQKEDDSGRKVTNE